jgi:lipopolysaccharide export system protein LptA
MKRSEAAKYSRWSAGVALLLAAITLGVFAERAWVRRVERKKAPPPAPVDVERLSTSINFSKVEANQTIFSVEASKSTDFKGENATLLEDVKITIFGRQGQRHDILHTKSCRYGKEKGDIDCAGAVQMDLMSAIDAEVLKHHPEEASARIMRVETRSVTFNRGTGLARTGEPVTFHFPSGEGQAVGVEYSSDEGTLRLNHEVHIKIHEMPAQPGKTLRVSEDVDISGSELDFARETRLILLKGPALAETSQQKLTAGLFRMGLDDTFHAQTLEALPGATNSRPEATFHRKSGDEVVDADSLHATFSPGGWVETIEAKGKIHGEMTGSTQNGTLSAESARMTMWPSANQAKELELHGAVHLQMTGVRSGENRELKTEALRLSFSKPELQLHESSRPAIAETLAPGSLSWTEAASPKQASPSAKTEIQATKLALNFNQSGKATRFSATGKVLAEKTSPGKPDQIATANEGWADLVSGGGWSQISLQHNVQLKQGDRTGKADQVQFVKADDTASLSGHASVRDTASESSAAKIVFTQGSGDIRAEGAVHSVGLTAKSSGVNLAPAPANITSDTLQANAKIGRATYSGHARMWQGDSVLEANTIVVQRETRTLTASDNVRAVFSQSIQKGKGQLAGRGAGLWHASAGKLTYWDKENRAHLDDNVLLQSADERLRGDKVDIFFTRAANGDSNVPAGTQQITRAVANGGVVVQQGDRRATADRGEYSAADGKFVMSGGNPTIFDASSGTTTGRQLTFFLADDTIIVESENGSRTLTKHRVEN